jgi:hypothetical protein
VFRYYYYAIFRFTLALLPSHSEYWHSLPPSPRYSFTQRDFLAVGVKYPQQLHLQTSSSVAAYDSCHVEDPSAR